MKGLQIWAVSNCRSVMALYENLAKAFDVPLRILCEEGNDERMKLGWRKNEFDHLDVVRASSTYNGRIRQLKEHCDWAQLFCSYQTNQMNCALACEAKRLGCVVGVCSEAPSNGSKPSLKRVLKGSPFFYWRTRMSVRGMVKSADFIANCSGEDGSGLKRLGWEDSQIIPFGYYPSALEGTSCRQRTVEDWENFMVLVTGVMDWRRGQDVVVDAMLKLKNRGYNPHVVFTQTGELYSGIVKRAKRGRLNVEFAGFASYDRLCRLYNECSVYIAAGRCEPWGMRINDALNCGAPLIVSDGMGGVRLVRNHSCGLEFHSGDSQGLSFALQSMIDDRELYLSISRNAVAAASASTPEKAGAWLASEIRKKFKAWG